MPFCRTLSVAGVGITLETEQPLLESENFKPFLLDGRRTDVRAVFSPVDALPPVTNVIFSQSSIWVTKDDFGQILTFFRDRPEDSSFYACTRWEGENIRVEYLPAYGQRVSELSNCFFHIGLESILLRHDRLCLHASCVDTTFGGLLFSGVSGIGKSTQAELWCRYRGARQINGDRPILSRQGEKWRAWGSPYAGSSRCHVNDSCPVTAIFLLAQEKECSLRRLSPAQAFRGIWPGLTVHSYDPAFVEKASALAIDLAAAVPVYRFGCTPDENAVIFLENSLGKEFSL